MNTKKKLEGEQDIPESTVELIRKSIRAGRFVPGQRLVESDLIQQFNTTNRQVRDALRLLEGEGLIQIEKNRGARVREISNHEVACILDILNALSVLAVQKALEVSTEPDTKKIIEKSLIETRKFKKNLSQNKTVHNFLNENVRFWDTIASVVNNPFLWEINNKLETLLSRLKIQGLTINSSPDLWIAKHEDILVAILNQDAKRAEKLVIKSSNDVTKAIIGLSEDVFSQD